MSTTTSQIAWNTQRSPADGPLPLLLPHPSMRAMSEPVSSEALVLGMIACRENARELIADADILTEHGRDARAYALLHTACEELGKFTVLEIGAKGLIAGRAPNWKRFWQRIRSHDSKSAQLEVQLMMLAGILGPSRLSRQAG